MAGEYFADFVMFTGASTFAQHARTLCTSPGVCAIWLHSMKQLGAVSNSAIAKLRITSASPPPGDSALIRYHIMVGGRCRESIV
jgi:hypothetical protein